MEVVNFPPHGVFLINTEGLIMKFIRHFAIAAIAVASLPAMAATDGVASATQSVGTYSNTFGGTASPQLRVFGLKDAVMTTASAVTVPTPYSTTALGIADTFCVGHTNGASVTLRFTSAGFDSSDQLWGSAKEVSTGALLSYHQSVGLQNNLNGLKNISKFDNAFIVTAPQTSVTDCSNPNVYKNTYRPSGDAAPADGIYTDLVTVTATLN
jgi:hypothetical protein